MRSAKEPSRSPHGLKASSFGVQFNGGGGGGRVTIFQCEGMHDGRVKIVSVLLAIDLLKSDAFRVVSVDAG